MKKEFLIESKKKEERIWQRMKGNKERKERKKIRMK